MPSILVSQIGYRPADPKIAVVRGGEEPGPLTVLDANGAAVLEVACGDAGMHWGIHLWQADFSALAAPGTYRAALPRHGVTSNAFDIADDILLARTLRACSIETLAVRVKGKLGWQDCAFDGRGFESHAIVTLGLCDVLDRVPRLDEALRAALLDNVRHGVEYMTACQRGDGSVMNEYYIARDRTVWTESGLAAVALARAAEVLSSGAALDAAKRAWAWAFATPCPSDAERGDEIETTRRIYGQYAPWTPPAARRGRDVLLLLRGAAELYRNTNDLTYRDRAVDLARTIRAEYQILEPTPDGFRGHFRAWPGSPVAQRAWEHAGWGYNVGCVLPDDVSGFATLIDLFPDSPEVPLWRAVLYDYAYGYLKPACAATPFGIYPLGDCEGELRFFGPSWHGFNGVYGQVARTAMLLARVFSDPSLERLAQRNLQWIAGANTGSEAATGVWQGLSWISGIGANAVKAWSAIPGSIGNGFCATPQFRVAHLDDIVDGPHFRTEEDWLVHNGSWLSGLAETSAPVRLKVRTTLRGQPVAADVEIDLAGRTIRNRANVRGVAIFEDLPRLAAGEARMRFGDHSVAVPLATLSGGTQTMLIDFATTLSVALTDEAVEVTNHGADDVDAVLTVTEVGTSARTHRTTLSIAAGAIATYRLEGTQGFVNATAVGPYTETFAENHR